MLVKQILLLFIVTTSLFGFSQENDNLKDSLLSANKSALIYNQLSDIYKSSSEFKLTKLYADSALFLSKKNNDKLEIGNAFINIGDYYYYTSGYDSSISSYKKAALIFEKIKHNENIASAYSNIGSINFSLGKYDEAIESFHAAVKYQKKTNNPKEIAIIYNNIATVYYNIDAYQNAITFYQLSLKYKKESNDFVSVAKGFNNLASVYGEIGDYEKSVNLFYESIKYSDKSKNKLLKSTTLNNIAGIYKDWQQHGKALELYYQALEIKNELNDLNGKANILNNIGIVLKQQKEFLAAETKFVEAKIIFEKIGNKKRYAIVNSNIGTIKEHHKEYEEAIKLYLESVEINIEINSPQNLAYDYLNLSKVYCLINNIDKSEYYSVKCLDVIKESGLKSIKIDVNKLLSDIYEKKGDYKKALIYYRKYTLMKDSVFTAKNKKMLNELNTKYETDKKNKEIKLLNATTDIQIVEIKAKRQERNLWIGISIMIFILTLISIYFFMNKKKLSEKLSKTVDEKNVLLREIHHRVKNNLQIISSLLNMQSRYLTDDKSKEIVNESQNRIKSMSLIHQKLYQEDNLTGIETRTYFSELIDSLISSYGIDKGKIQLDIEIENVLLDVDTSIPLGLILNEILSNAFKHGIDKEKGAFTFKFSQKSNDELFLFVKDNGDGIPADFDIKKSKSYGMKLIQSLSKKLKATIEFKNNDGLEITMRIFKFKITKKA